MTPFTPVSWRLRSRTLSTARHTLVMGILNVTPDSFSDGGRFASSAEAVSAGKRLAGAGADIVDVGGESTRPGAGTTPVDEELARIVPVVGALAADGVIVSVDTSKPDVAAAAIDAGAEIVNDVTALEHGGMVEICSESGAGVILMHKQGVPATMQVRPAYENVVAEVGDYLESRARWAEERGLEPDRICVDPGIGFGKTLEHNLLLLRDLHDMVARGRPVLVGASRKNFIGRVLDAAGRPTSPAERDVATGAITALAIAAGAAVVRVHDARTAFDSARIADAIVRGRTAVDEHERE